MTPKVPFSSRAVGNPAYVQAHERDAGSYEEAARALNDLLACAYESGASAALNDMADEFNMLGYATRKAASPDTELSELYYKRALQIDPTPAHDAVFLEVRTSFHNLFQLDQLFGAQTPLRPGRLAVDQPLRTLRIGPMDPVAQGLPIHPTDPRCITAAHAFAYGRKRQKPPALVGV